VIHERACGNDRQLSRLGKVTARVVKRTDEDGRTDGRTRMRTKTMAVGSSMT
jgi:hypothetical protein